MLSGARIITLLCIILLGFQLSGCATSSGSGSGTLASLGLGGSDEQEKPATPNPDAPVLNADRALELVNAVRAKKKLKPLTLDARLTNAASVLSAYMASQDKMSHTGPQGEDVGKRMTAAGYKFHLAAENIGVGQKSIEEMVADWEKSPPHRKNILLPDAKNMGIALSYNPNSKYKTFWTLVIGST